MFYRIGTSGLDNFSGVLQNRNVRIRTILLVFHRIGTPGSEQFFRQFYRIGKEQSLMESFICNWYSADTSVLHNALLGQECAA